MSLYVITGGPSCGKSTVIHGLRERGYRVNDELARELLNDKKKRGIDISNLNNDHPRLLEFEIELYEKQLTVDKKALASQKTYFGDRASPDVPAYCKHHMGRIPNEIDLFKLPRYDGIFLLDMLPFEHDGIRLEKDPEEGLKIHDAITSMYRMLGYTPIRVPVANSKKDALTERVNFVLQTLQEQKTTRSVD
ncbi:MAG: ATP-binding protein [Nanoarchaeota archaeon]|nr:ATP-binding protein [Nanoarchaeota archaeon]